MMPFAVSLVLGGTGMLAGATRWLAARSEKTILVARHASSFMSTPGVVAFDADWHSSSFAQEIEAVLKPVGAGWRPRSYGFTSRSLSSHGSYLNCPPQAASSWSSVAWTDGPKSRMGRHRSPPCGSVACALRMAVAG